MSVTLSKANVLIIHSSAVVVMLHKVKLIYDVDYVCSLYDEFKALGDAEECEKEDRMSGMTETRSRERNEECWRGIVAAEIFYLSASLQCD